jgi:hypothetical protein
MEPTLAHPLVGLKSLMGFCATGRKLKKLVVRKHTVLDAGPRLANDLATRRNQSQCC